MTITIAVALPAIPWIVFATAMGCTSQAPHSRGDAGQGRSDGGPPDAGLRETSVGPACTTASDCPGWMAEDSCEVCKSPNSDCRQTWCASGTCMTGYSLCQAGCYAGTPRVKCEDPTPRCEQGLGACVAGDPSCRVRSGVCVALDAGDPTAIVSMPSCDGGGLNLELLHSDKVQILTGPAPEAGAAPSCEISGPCKMQHRSRQLSPAAFVDGTVYCANDGSWSAFAILEQNSAERLVAEEIFVGGALCFGHTKTMYRPPLGNGASEGFVGVPPKVPDCEPGCCPNIP